MEKFLVVVDDTVVAQVVKVVLQNEHHTVDLCHDGADALEYLRVTFYDLIILDLGLPGTSGMEVCRAARGQKLPTSILMLTGRTALQEKEAGLGSGADDYLTKPFDERELSARVRALLRSPHEQQLEILQIRDVTLDPASHVVKRGDVLIDLLPQEFALLHFLMKHPDQIFSVQALIEKVWKFDSTASEAAVFSCVKRLRQKLRNESGANQSEIIETVRGTGYRFNSV